MPRHHRIQGQDVPFTAEEETQWDLQEKEWNDNRPTRKLNEIKQLRLIRLKETDYLANSDMTMPDYIKTWRQSLRDIPSNHTDEDAYNLLLATDSDGKLTHSIWTQPTS
tara:strand:- start:135 stop:461 length:327 start_codon:yes stop_codon:yes gene_type:complete